jgi:hypothetical protein
MDPPFSSSPVGSALSVALLLQLHSEKNEPLLYPPYLHHFPSRTGGHGLSFCIASAMTLCRCTITTFALFVLSAYCLLPQCLSSTHYFPNSKWEVDCLLHCFCNRTLKMSPYYICLVCVESNFPQCLSMK